MSTHDLVIRNGLVVDGSGKPAFEADIAIDGTTITAVGKVDGTGKQEIDAKGQIVTPGFVDIHTHYDGQATWGETLDPSSIHGVTTAVMGNCGIGFAPCRPGDHDRLIRLMEGVEDIPFPVLAEGLPWNWQTFPEYMDRLAEHEYDIDLAAQLPHAALRVYVMGERGANREAATEDEIATMRALTKSAIEAGALGFSTSRTLNHRASDGQPTPTLTASEAELTGIALGVADAGKGVLQFVSDFSDGIQELEMLWRLASRSGRPLSISLAQADAAPESWRGLLSAIDQANQNGLQVRAQVAARPVGILLGLELSLNPFTAYPSYKDISGKPLEEQVALLKHPDFQARLLAEEPEADHPFVQSIIDNVGKMFVLSDPPDYEPPEDQLIGAMARARNMSPAKLALDLLLENEGRGVLCLPFMNYAHGNLDAVHDMLVDPGTLPGLSDGGAHVGMICDGSFPTTMLTHWVRDRSRGERIPLEQMVRKQTRETAEWVGLYDRGLVAPGYRADLNVIDFDNLTLHLPEVLHDLPGGGRRLMQRATGYTATMVAGQVVYRDGVATGAKPGRLVRGTQSGPAPG